MSTRSAPTYEPEDSDLAGAFDDDRHAWTRVTGTRRRLVLAEAGLLAALFVVTMAAASTDAGSTDWHVAVLTVGLLAFVPLHSVLNVGIRGLYDRSGRTLDEHQRRLREQSHAAVRWLSTALMFAAWTGAAAVVSLTGHTALGLATGFLLWFAAGLLPYWHLGWTLPDEDEALEPT